MKSASVFGILLLFSCESRLDLARDEDASSVQRLQQGSTGGAANVFKLSEAAGLQQSFTLDGVTESVNEFNGVLSVAAPVFSSGALSGAVLYTSSHHQLRVNGTVTPQHQGVAGRWNSNFFGRFVDFEQRIDLEGSVGARMHRAVPVEAYYVETAGGGRLSQLVQHYGRQPPTYASPRLPGLETNPNQAILEDGSAVESTPSGFIVSWRNGGRTHFTHRVGNAWNFGAEGVYATRSEGLDGRVVEIEYYDNTPIPRVATEFWPEGNGTLSPVSRVFFFLEGQDTSRVPQNVTGLHASSRLGSIRYPGALSQNRTQLDASWLETRFAYNAANQLSAITLAGRTTSFRYEETSPYQLLVGIDRPSGSRVDFTFAAYRMPVGYCVPYSQVCEADVVRDDRGWILWDEETLGPVLTGKRWFELSVGITQRTVHFQKESHTWRWKRYPAQHPHKPQTSWANAENYYSVTESLPPSVVPDKQLVVRRYFGVPQKQGSPEAAKTGVVLLERVFEGSVITEPCDSSPPEEDAIDYEIPNGSTAVCQKFSERLLTTQEFGYSAYAIGALKAFPSHVDLSAQAEFMRGFVWRAYPSATISRTPGTMQTVVSYYGKPQKPEAQLRSFSLKRFSENGGAEFDVFGHAPAQTTLVTVDTQVKIVPAKTQCAPLRCWQTRVSATHIKTECAEDFSCQQDTLSHVPTPISLAHSVERQTDYLIDSSAFDADYEALRLYDLPVAQRSYDASGALLAHAKTYYDNRGYSSGCAVSSENHAASVLGRVTATETLDVKGQHPSLWSYTRYFHPGPSVPPSAVEETLSGPECVGQRFSYAPMLNIPSQSNASGAPTQVEAIYFENGQKKSRVVSRAAYNAVGGVLVAEDENGARSRTEYDFLGRPLAVYTPRRPNSPTQTFVYVDVNLSPTDAFQPTSVTTRTHDVHVIENTVFFDALGRTFQTQTQGDDAGQSVVVASSSRFVGATGLVSASTRPYVMAQGSSTSVFISPQFQGPREEVTYDFLGRPLEAHQVGAGGVTRLLSKSQYGDSTPGLSPLQSASISPEGDKTVTTSDALGRTTSVQLADGTLTSYAYDALGRVLSVTHPDGLVSSREYDGLGREVRGTTPEDGTVSQTYDAAGRLLLRADARGEEVHFMYDALGREVRSFSANESVETVYDAYPPNSVFAGSPYSLGRVTRKASPASVEDFRYDEEGRVVEMATTLTGLSGTKRQVFHYSDTGRLESYEYQPGTSEALRTSLQYDRLLRPVSSVLNAHLRSPTTLGRVSYDVEGRLLKRELLPQVGLYSEAYEYDDFFRLRGVNVPSRHPQALFGYRLGYEEAVSGSSPRHDGLPALVEWTQPVAGPATAFFEYDARGQLTSATLHRQGSEDTTKSLSVRYDSVGNIRSLTRGGQATHYQYESNTRRLLNVSGATQGAFAYDAAGQLVADSRFAARLSSYSKFEYSAFGFTSSVENSATRLRFAHDALGQKVATYHDVASASGYASVSGRHLVRNASGKVVAEYKNGQLVRHMLGELGTLETGIEGRSGLQYFLKDFLGSVRVRLHESGDILEVTDFDAFGQEWADRSRNQDGVDGPQQFTGYTSHSELPSSFFHANARLYDAALGRFFKPDPLAELEPATTSYAYARNSPTAVVDPTGLFNQGPGEPTYIYDHPGVTVTAHRLSPLVTSYAVARGGFDVFNPMHQTAAKRTGKAMMAALESHARSMMQPRDEFGGRSHMDHVIQSMNIGMGMRGGGGLGGRYRYTPRTRVPSGRGARANLGQTTSGKRRLDGSEGASEEEIDPVGFSGHGQLLKYGEARGDLRTEGRILNLTREADELYDWQYPGMYTVAVHGPNFKVSDVYRSMLDNGYMPHTPILLLSCNAAKGFSAQVLATKSGSIVKASPYVLYSDGTKGYIDDGPILHDFLSPNGPSRPAMRWFFPH